MLKVIIYFYYRAKYIINSHVPIYRILQLPVLNEINRMKEKISNTECEQFDHLLKAIDEQMNELQKESMAIL